MLKAHLRVVHDIPIIRDGGQASSLSGFFGGVFLVIDISAPSPCRLSHMCLFSEGGKVSLHV